MESTGPLLRCPLVREHNRPLASLSASRPEASAGRPVPRRRANKDGIDALLVAAGVTENGADPSESLRDRAAALEADVFRFLPRQSHQASPRCRIASPPKLPQRRVPSSQSRQDNEAVKSWPRSRTGIGEVEPAAGGSGGRRRRGFCPRSEQENEGRRVSISSGRKGSPGLGVASTEPSPRDKVTSGPPPCSPSRWTTSSSALAGPKRFEPVVLSPPCRLVARRPMLPRFPASSAEPS
jgi:hypothetical protein